MSSRSAETRSRATQALVASTFSFTVCFAVWTIFAIIGLRIREQLHLSQTEFGLLVGTPILTGSLLRPLLGVWTDQYGGRLVFAAVMLAAAAATYLLTFATTYPMVLLAALGVGIAGGAFSVGVAYVSRWYPQKQQGTVLGIFGMGNVGAAATKMLAPLIMVQFGWESVARIWSIALVVTTAIFLFFSSDDPKLEQMHREHRAPVSMWRQFSPLRHMMVWQFSLYYFFVFGGYIALASWLPAYFVGVYGLPVALAGLLGTAYSIPASVFRPLGGVLSDRIGARTVMYWTFIASLICTFILSYPPTDYVVHGVSSTITFSLATNVVAFTLLVFVLGFFMSLGKAAVYKDIAVYYPENVGAVGGVVGMMGGLGGFVLPIVFGAMNDMVGLWTSCFMLLFAITAVSLLWMHLSILRAERRAHLAKHDASDLSGRVTSPVEESAMAGQRQPRPRLVG